MSLETILLLITESSGILALLMGLVALFYAYKASSNLIKGEFRTNIFSFFFFLLFVMVGVISMVIYHFVDSELTDNIWYIFMFLALVFSAYESYRNIKFGKSFEKIKFPSKNKRK